MTGSLGRDPGRCRGRRRRSATPSPRPRPPGSTTERWTATPPRSWRCRGSRRTSWTRWSTRSPPPAAVSPVSSRSRSGPPTCGETSLVDTLGSQLMTQLDDSRIDPAASTYVRFGQLLGLAMPPGQGRAPHRRRGGDDPQEPRRRRAPHRHRRTRGWRRWCWSSCRPDAGELEDADATEPSSAGIATGVRANAAGVVVLGDTASGEDGLLAALRERRGRHGDRRDRRRDRQRRSAR